MSLTKRHLKLLKRAVSLQLEIDKVKPIYRELDKINEELLRTGFVKGGGFYLHDNFAEKNTCFKTVAMARFTIMPQVTHSEVSLAVNRRRTGLSKINPFAKVRRTK